MKRSAVAYLTALEACIQDVCFCVPGRMTFFERDLSRLKTIVETRGFDILFIDLPELGKLYDKGLSTGYFDKCAPPKSLGRRSDGWPKLFGELILLSFHESGILRDNPEPDLVFATRQIFYLFKKINLECSDEAVQQAVSDFVDIEVRSNCPSGRWSGWGDSCSLQSEPLSVSDLRDGHPGLRAFVRSPRVLLDILQLTSDIVVSRFPRSKWEDLIPRHGPGAVSDQRSGSDKYNFPSWPDRLEKVFPFRYFGQPNELFELDQPPNNEVPAKLIAVPKTLKGPRLIASEPTALQYCQQAILGWLRANTPTPLRTCIDFSSQEPSREKALLSSRTGDLATVDLSSASDRLSLWLVERLFRKSQDLLDMIDATRSIYCTDGTESGVFSLIKLRKMACQGCAYTFPVQSMAYAMIAIAVRLYESGYSPYPRKGYDRKITIKAIHTAARKVRVFGDDIIVPSQDVPVLAHLLLDLGLKVNASKTHHKGHFRESCGMDAYRGHNVTPLYIRSNELAPTAASLTSWIDVRNNAYQKGLWALTRLFDSSLYGMFPRSIATSTVSTQGLSCLSFRFSGIPSGCKVRFNRHLQRQEYRGLTVNSKARKVRRDSPFSLLQYFLEKPSPDVFWMSGYVSRVSSTIRAGWVPVPTER